MDQETPKELYGPDDPRHAQVRSFIQRVFELQAQNLYLSDIEQIAREELDLGNISDKRVRNVIRYVAAHFPTIFEIEQPSPKKYQAVMDRLRDELAGDE